jgi:hypothetical protein
MMDSLPVEQIFDDIEIESWLERAGLWGRLRGHETASGRRVHIGIAPSSTRTVEELQTRLAYDVVGVGACVLVAPLDRLAPKQAREHVAVVERIGTGIALTEAGPRMTDHTRWIVTLQLARTVARAAAEQIVLGGLHPDLIWVDSETGSDAVITPRFPVLLATKRRQRSTGPGPWPFSEIGPFLDPAMPNPWGASFASDVYCLGLVIAWLFGGEHPFAATQMAANGWLSAMEEGVWNASTRPPALGSVLDGMLVPEPARRITIDEVVAALEAAAALGNG